MTEKFFQIYLRPDSDIDLGDNTKLFLQGRGEDGEAKSPTLQVNPTQSFLSTSDVNEKCK